MIYIAAEYKANKYADPHSVQFYFLLVYFFLFFTMASLLFYYPSLCCAASQSIKTTRAESMTTVMDRNLPKYSERI